METSDGFEKTLAIRRFRPADAQTVWDLHVLAMRGEEPHAEDSFFADLQTIDQSFLQQGGEFLVGVVGNQVVAMGGFTQGSCGEIEIKRMRVHPGWQRRGIGAALLRRLEKHAADRGNTVAYLETATVQQGALALYRKNGYTKRAVAVRPVLR